MRIPTGGETPSHPAVSTTLTVYTPPALTVIPALALIMLNCVWVSFCFGILSTRYRDIGPLLGSLVQLLFFMTPIIWNAETLRQQGAGRWSKIIEINPLLHYLDILRAPLLGAHQEPRHWVVVITLTVLGWCAAAAIAASVLWTLWPGSELSYPKVLLVTAIVIPFSPWLLAPVAVDANRHRRNG